MRIWTKKGDAGETGLLFGGRISKADLRTEAYGSLDEAVSALGLARAASAREEVRRIVLEYQQELFTVGAEMATLEPNLHRLKERIGAEHVAKIEGYLVEYETKIDPLKGFIMPGGTLAAAALDLARTLLRRTERRAVQMNREGMLHNPEVLRYLNRLSDLIYILARYEEKEGRRASGSATI